MGTWTAGKRVGRYLLLRHLGHGGMGVVFLAEDEMLGRPVALKLLHPGLATQPHFVRLFRQEARIVARLEHPNIVPIHIMDQVGGDLVIDMAYIEGGSLASALGGGGITLSRAVAVAYDVLNALAYCHADGAVHRDVKPSNILLARDRRALLSDFGLARVMAEYSSASMRGSSSSGMFVGTPKYAPPEAWDGARPSPTWDLYSLGLVLYEAIGSGLPYDARTPLEMVKQMAERPLVPLRERREDVSGELSDLIEALLRPVPGARVQSAAEALEWLKHVPELHAPEVEDLPTMAGGPPRVRPRWWAGSIAARFGGFVAPYRYYLIGAWIAALFLVMGMLVGREHGAAWFDNPVPEALESLLPGPAEPSQDRPDEESFRVLDTVDATARQLRRGNWLFRAQTAPDAWEGFAEFDTELWYFGARRGPDGDFRFEGYWAGYTDSNARVFRYGPMSGDGRLLLPEQEMAVTLQFRSAQDGSHFERSYVLRRSFRPGSAAAYYRALERSPFIQAILYNELVPRRPDVVDSVDGLFEHIGLRRLLVPAVGEDAFRLDGRLDEEGWPVAGHGPDAAHPGLTVRVGPPGAWLAARYAGKGLYLGVYVPGPHEKPLLHIAIKNRFSSRPEASPLYEVDTSDGVITGHRLLHGTESSWEPAWQIAASTDGAWQAEAFLPFDGFGGDPPPGPGSRWWLDARVLTPDTATLIAAWGSHEAEAAPLGVILTFGPRNAP